MSRKNVYKLNSKHLITDDTEEDNENVDWSINSESDNKSENNKNNLEKDDGSEDDGSEDDDYYNLQEILLEQKQAEPEINIEVIEDENKEKAIKISIDLELENETNDIINIDFTINKKTFLKFAKKLK